MDNQPVNNETEKFGGAEALLIRKQPGRAKE